MVEIELRESTLLVLSLSVVFASYLPVHFPLSSSKKLIFFLGKRIQNESIQAQNRELLSPIFFIHKDGVLFLHPDEDEWDFSSPIPLPLPWWHGIPEGGKMEKVRDEEWELCRKYTGKRRNLYAWVVLLPSDSIPGPSLIPNSFKYVLSMSHINSSYVLFIPSLKGKSRKPPPKGIPSEKPIILSSLKPTRYPLLNWS